MNGVVVVLGAEREDGEVETRSRMEGVMEHLMRMEGWWKWLNEDDRVCMKGKVVGAKRKYEGMEWEWEWWCGVVVILAGCNDLMIDWRAGNSLPGYRYAHHCGPSRF